MCSLEYSWADNSDIAGFNPKVENLNYAELGIEEIFQPLKNKQPVITYERQGSDFPGGI